MQQHLVALAALIKTHPGDWEQALAWLYRLIRARVASAVRRGWFVEDSEDLVQDLVIKLMPAVHSYVPGPQGIGGFLRFIADLRITGRCKQMRLQRQLIQFEADIGSFPHPAVTFDIDARLDLAALLTQLSADEREIVQLLLDGDTPRTLVERCGITPEAARKRVQRTRDALRTLLRKSKGGSPLSVTVEREP